MVGSQVLDVFSRENCDEIVGSQVLDVFNVSSGLERGRQHSFGENLSSPVAGEGSSVPTATLPARVSRQFALMNMNSVGGVVRIPRAQMCVALRGRPPDLR